jgi:hypothetical protein
MKAAGIIVNIFLPGIGTLIVGKWLQGILQFILALVAAMFIFTGIGMIIGIPLGFVALIWAIVSVAAMQDRPVEVVVVNRPH